MSLTLLYVCAFTLQVQLLLSGHLVRTIPGLLVLACLATLLEMQRA